MKKPILSILRFHEEYPDNDTCLERLFRDRFPKPVCPVCKRVNQYHRIASRARFSCSCGKHHIFPKEGTIFEHSSTDLVKWFFAIYLFSQSRNGVAAKELQRELQVTYKTAWRMAQEIRKLMNDEPVLQTGEVEADETWIGGKAKGWKNRNTNKTIVFGSVQRKGKVNASIVKDCTEQSLLVHIRSNVAKGAKLLTDDWRAYKNIAHIEGYAHSSVNHSARQYVDGTTHTNTIEGFWSQLKRSIDGTYHVVSPKYLSSYLGEFVFRYNNGRRTDSHLFDILIGRVALPHVAAASRIGAYQCLL
ncbi:MAG: IS1595 family transposase [Candidatus Peribacteraceae bacterium]|nr:IS1595 family transposase [Candidatus Peribacteraceae bacterium]MDD5074910.1 IS1595 family transposase [Candidatus Peribacteraceae bacterium]